VASLIQEPSRPRKPWRVDWMERRRHRTRRFATKAEAERFVGDLARGKGASDSRMTLTDWLVEWARTRGPEWVERTREERGEVADALIVPHLGGMRLHEIGRRDVRAWRTDLLRQAVTPYRANRAVSILSAALGAAVEDDLIDANPCAGLRKLPTTPRRIVPATLAQVEAIRAALPTERDRAIVSLLAYAGTRPGELLTLAWEDVGDAGLVIRTADGGGEDKGTKTGVVRTVPLVRPLRDDLEAVDRRAETILGPIDWPNWRNRAWKPARQAAGFRGRPYDLRHTFASLLIAEGRSVHEVARLLGHSTPRLTLDTYGHLFDEAQLRRNESMERAAMRERRHAASSISRKAAETTPRGADRRGGGGARRRRGAVGRSSGAIR
jgi:integrase